MTKEMKEMMMMVKIVNCRPAALPLVKTDKNPLWKSLWTSEK